MSKDYEAEQNFADEMFNKWIEDMDETQLETRHFLLDRKGVKAVRHWFDSPLEDLEGRLCTEEMIFHFARPDCAGYGRLFVTPVPGEPVLYAVRGGGTILAEIRPTEEE